MYIHIYTYNIAIYKHTYVDMDIMACTSHNGCEPEIEFEVHHLPSPANTLGSYYEALCGCYRGPTIQGGI